jgi:hypothetical protein
VTLRPGAWEDLRVLLVLLVRDDLDDYRPSR